MNSFISKSILTLLIISNTASPMEMDYWDKAGIGRSLIPEIDSNIKNKLTIIERRLKKEQQDNKACIDLMFSNYDRKTESYNLDLLRGDYEPVQKWEISDEDSFYLRLLFPMIRNDNEYKSYIKFHYHPRSVYINSKLLLGLGNWDDLVFTIKKTNKLITDEQAEELRKRPYLLKVFCEVVECDIKLCDLIRNKRVGAFRASLSKSAGRVKDVVNFAENVIMNTQVKETGQSIAIDLGMTALRQIVSGKVNEWTSKGTKKAELEYLDKYKAKINSIMEHKDLIELIQKDKKDNK